MNTAANSPVVDYATPRPRRLGEWFYLGSWTMVLLSMVGIVWGTSMTGGLCSIPPDWADIRRHILAGTIILAAPTLGLVSGIIAGWRCESRLNRWAGFALAVWHAMALYSFARMLWIFRP